MQTVRDSAGNLDVLLQLIDDKSVYSSHLEKCRSRPGIFSATLLFACLSRSSCQFELDYLPQVLWERVGLWYGSEWV